MASITVDEHVPFINPSIWIFVQVKRRCPFPCEKFKVPVRGLEDLSSSGGENQ
jgi:hypothetical protein